MEMTLQFFGLCERKWYLILAAVFAEWYSTRQRLVDYLLRHSKKEIGFARCLIVCILTILQGTTDSSATNSRTQTTRSLRKNKSGLTHAKDGRLHVIAITKGKYSNFNCTFLSTSNFSWQFEWNKKQTGGKEKNKHRNNRNTASLDSDRQSIVKGAEGIIKIISDKRPEAVRAEAQKDSCYKARV